tara:strand:- start:6193 stop:6486 length:294 start_codon:yes stop_codon:yes gene_type:complete
MMRNIFYYFGFSYLKPTQYWPIRIIVALYFIVVYSGLIYDLTTEKPIYYSNNSQYLNILLSDNSFYYIYILPVVLVFIISYLCEFFLTVNKKKPTKK